MAKNLSSTTPASPIEPPRPLPLEGVGRATRKAPTKHPLLVLIALPGEVSVIRRYVHADPALDERLVTVRVVRRELRGGADGVRLLRQGRWNLDGLVDNVLMRGQVLLHPERVSYLADDGIAAVEEHGYRLAWETLDGDDIVTTDAGRRQYADTLAQWASNGTIPRPTLAALTRARETTASILDRMSTPTIDPVSGAIVALAKSDVAGCASIARDLAAIDRALGEL